MHDAGLEDLSSARLGSLSPRPTSPPHPTHSSTYQPRSCGSACVCERERQRARSRSTRGAFLPVRADHCRNVRDCRAASRHSARDASRQHVSQPLATLHTFSYLQAAPGPSGKKYYYGEDVDTMLNKNAASRTPSILQTHNHPLSIPLPPRRCKQRDMYQTVR